MLQKLPAYLHSSVLRFAGLFLSNKWVRFLLSPARAAIIYQHIMKIIVSM